MNKYRQIFDDYGISRRKAAKEIGISNGYLSDILNGKRPPKCENEINTYLRNLSRDIVNIL